VLLKLMRVLVDAELREEWIASSLSAYTDRESSRATVFIKQCCGTGTGTVTF
jgi:hypothetical protein